VADRRTPLEELLAFLANGDVRLSAWSKVVEAAGLTLTIGIFAERVLAQQRELDPPQAILDLLGDIRDRARKRNSLISKQFFELGRALNKVGVIPIPMKGMARLLRGTADTSRLLSDIDVLVPSRRRSECISAMRALGYILVEEGGASESSVWARSCDVGAVDLHVQLKPHYLRLHYEALVPLCARQEFRGATIFSPSPTSEALMLIAHDQLHDADYWRGLVDVRHLLDLHELAREGIDWTALVQMLPPGAPRRAAQLAFLSARHLLGSDLPAIERLDRFARLQLLRRRLQARLPALKDTLTLVALALDPPPVSPANEASEGTVASWWRKLNARLVKYLRRDNPGKVSIGLEVS
jgi:hypothetical protein